MEQAHVNIKSK